MAPVKVVAVLEQMARGVAEAGSRIQQAVGNIDEPDDKAEKRGGPQRQNSMHGPCEGAGPGNSNGRRIEAGEVPEFQCGGSIPGGAAGKSVRCGRIEGNQCHCFDFRRQRPKRLIPRQAARVCWTRVRIRASTS